MQSTQPLATPATSGSGEEVPAQRWLRIIPVALIMYTISYVDRTNVSLALDPTRSSMMKDLLMDDRMKGKKLTEGGRLADIAPTALLMMGIDKPKEMNGQSLVAI